MTNEKMIEDVESAIASKWETRKSELQPLHRWLLEEAAQAAITAMQPYLPKWKPISEYVEPPYAGFDPIVLLGWKGTESNGVTQSICYYGCGYWDEFKKKWVDRSDNKEWSSQPTHFALVCQDIRQPRKNDHPQPPIEQQVAAQNQHAAESEL